jgi:hypothetical protein
MQSDEGKETKGGAETKEGKAAEVVDATETATDSKVAEEDGKEGGNGGGNAEGSPPPSSSSSSSTVPTILTTALATAPKAAKDATDVHNPDTKLLFRDFVEALVRIANVKLEEELPEGTVAQRANRFLLARVTMEASRRMELSRVVQNSVLNATMAPPIVPLNSPKVRSSLNFLVFF